MAVKSGYIYILKHPSDSSLVKVGITTRGPSERLKEHNTDLKAQAGKIVAKTGKKWELKEAHKVPDVYMAESAFHDRYPLSDMPFLKSEVFKMDNQIFTEDWVREGINLATSVGIRSDVTQPPIPKTKPKKGQEWVKEQLKDTGIKPIKGYGNGITRVLFECEKGHIFKLDSGTLCRFLACPVCSPESFDSYSLRRVEFPHEN